MFKLTYHGVMFQFFQDAIKDEKMLRMKKAIEDAMADLETQKVL